MTSNDNEIESLPQSKGTDLTPRVNRSTIDQKMIDASSTPTSTTTPNRPSNCLNSPPVISNQTPIASVKRPRRPSYSSGALGITNSPLHPPKIMTSHDPIPNIASDSNNDDWMNKKVDALFSPVLQFWNGSNNKSFGSTSSDDEEILEEIDDQQNQSSTLECHETTDMIDDDISSNSLDESDAEDEFNPYLFIRSLPPYVPHKISPCLSPKLPSSPPITLVLDLDETLVHCTIDPIPNPDLIFSVFFGGTEYQVHARKRPYLEQFLKYVGPKFEVICFTASQKVYANELLDLIDPNNNIKHRVFREHCLPMEGNFLKDLNILGRNLDQTVLVDNSPHAFGYQVDNGIPIESWFEDGDDNELIKLQEFLDTLHGENDVRLKVRERFQTWKLIAEA